MNHTQYYFFVTFMDTVEKGMYLCTDVCVLNQI